MTRALAIRRDAGGRILPSTPDELAALGPPTRDAINAAKGNQGAAARALGISKVTLWHRLNECTVTLADGVESLRSWLDRDWPQRDGRRSVDVVRVDAEHGALLSYWGPIRVYVLAAHGDVAEGAHVNRVPAVGKVRGRVVCQMCKGERDGS